MTLFQSILLGIVQGLTEFLPVSSSGHLVVVPHLLGWNLVDKNASFVFDVLVQVATLVAVFTYFWKDLVVVAQAFVRGIISRKPFEGPMARLGWYILLASVPAGLLGITIKNSVEHTFSSPLAAGIFLLVTAGLLLVAERAGRRTRGLNELDWKDALWIGVFQAFALFPGISRSGSTITGAMTRDLERPTAAKFSFLMSIPIMLAAGLVATLDLLEIPSLANLFPIFLPGFISAAVVGYLSIRWLLGYLNRHPLYGFSVYCAVVGLLTILTSLLWNT